MIWQRSQLNCTPTSKGCIGKCNGQRRARISDLHALSERFNSRCNVVWVLQCCWECMGIGTSCWVCTHTQHTSAVRLRCWASFGRMSSYKITRGHILLDVTKMIPSSRRPWTFIFILLNNPRTWNSKTQTKPIRRFRLNVFSMPLSLLTMSIQ